MTKQYVRATLATLEQPNRNGMVLQAIPNRMYYDLLIGTKVYDYPMHEVVGRLVQVAVVGDIITSKQTIEGIIELDREIYPAEHYIGRSVGVSWKYSRRSADYTENYTSPVAGSEDPFTIYNVMPMGIHILGESDIAADAQAKIHNIVEEKDVKIALKHRLDFAGRGQYDKYMDKECIKICDILNSLPNIKTVNSCCGHGKEPFTVFFQIINGTNSVGLSFLGRCTDHRYGCNPNIKIQLSNSDMNYDTIIFMLTTTKLKGQAAYDAIEKFCNILVEHLNSPAYIGAFICDLKDFDIREV